MKKFAVKVIAVLGILLMSSQSVFASANSNTAEIKVDGVIVVTAQSQMLYVELGRFFREYNAQLVSALTNSIEIQKHTQEIIDSIEIEAQKWVSNFPVTTFAE